MNGKTHRDDGPALTWENGEQCWYIRNVKYYTNAEYQEAAGISDEDMLAMVLKYGNVR
jgi:hypothetical protein